MASKSSSFGFPSSAPSVPSSLPLTPDLIPTFQIGRLFTDNSQRLNSFDFRAAGDLLVTASDDDSIHLYNLDSGSMKKEILSKRYGCDCIRFTHHHNAVIVASGSSSRSLSSAAADYTIRYLSLHDNRYLKYFKGHKGPVLALQMSPIDDTFLSSSADQTVRLWDLRTNVCQGLCKTTSHRPQVSYDPQGLIFAIAGQENSIKLYDKRTYDKGPFATFILPSDSQIGSQANGGVMNQGFSLNSFGSETHEWSGIKFSPDGKYMLLSTLQGKLFLIDAFNGELRATYEGIVNRSRLPIEACFSPDSQYVLTGSENGSVHVFETQSGEERFQWENAHPGAVQLAQWCPDRLCFATASTSLALWVPNLQTIKLNEKSEKTT